MRNKKYLIILVIIIIVFMVVISKAFDYVPKNEKSNTPNIENSTKTMTESEENTIVDETSDDEKLENNNATSNTSNNSDSNVSNARQYRMSTAEKIETLFFLAEQDIENENYEKAKNSYSEIYGMTDRYSTLARVHEGLANVYAIESDYKAALENAIKSYDYQESASRKVLIARLYYQTGNIAKAKDIINQVLVSDFTEER